MPEPETVAINAARLELAEAPGGQPATPAAGLLRGQRLTRPRKTPASSTPTPSRPMASCGMVPTRR
jgi:hypothetical protein